MRADAHRRDVQREAGLVVGLDRNAAQRGDALAGSKRAGRIAAQKPPQRLFALHADDRFIVARHAGIGHIGRAAGRMR